MAKKEKKPQQPLHIRVRAALRKVDQRSTEWNEAKSRAKHPTKKKWFVCEMGKEDTPFVQVDHVIAVGSLEPDLSNLSEWAQRLFVPADKRQVLCLECHAPKTKKGNAEIRAKKKQKDVTAEDLDEFAKRFPDQETQ